MDFEKRLTEIAGAANVKLEEPMKNHTTFRIGGPARYFVTPENADALILVIGLCRGEEKPFAVIGNGSNLLVSDQGYQGVVISTEKLDHCQVEGNQIRAEAGVKLARMAKQALRLEQAKLLGFDCYSNFVLDENMAKNSQYPQ